MTDQTQEPIAAQTQEPVTQPENASTQGQATAELNLNDLAALKSIIDVATQRGAFRANELEAVENQICLWFFQLLLFRILIITLLWNLSRLIRRRMFLNLLKLCL